MLNAGEIKCAFDDCSRIFFSPDELKEHRQQHSPARQFPCADCSRSFQHDHELNLHMMRRHSEESVTPVTLLPYACNFPGCSYSTRVVRKLVKHKQNTHSSTIYTCLLCGWCFKKYQRFNFHVAKHNTETPGVFRCIVDDCEKLFENGDSLKAHIKEAHHVAHETPFKCNIGACKFSALKIRSLQLHKNRMHTFDLFKCCLCGARSDCFGSFKRHLQQHKMIHPAGVLKCMKLDCTETFSSPIDMLEHVEAHDGVHRFECQECGHLTGSKMQMREHVSQHSAAIACSIPACLFISDTKQNMKFHMKEVHSSWFYFCQHCEEGFCQSSDLKKHMSLHELGEPRVSINRNSTTDKKHPV